MAAKTTTGAKSPPIRATVNWLNPDENGNVRASVSMSIGGAYTVHGIKVMSGSKGDFVSMPSYKSGDGYKDIFHAVTADARQQMNDAVFAAYEQLVEQAQDAPAEEPEEGGGMTMQ